jgi:hypothetical protein
MSYSTTERLAQRDLRRAIKRGLPEWLRLHIERTMSHAKCHAEHSRNAATPADLRPRLYDRALRELLSMSDLLGAFRTHVDEPFPFDPGCVHAYLKSALLSVEPEGLTDPQAAYFLEWLEKIGDASGIDAANADADIAAGRVHEFKNAEDAIAYLRTAPGATRHPEHPLFPGWLQCNPAHPMPPETERDQCGQQWMHDLATRQPDGTVLCPACGHRWQHAGGVPPVAQASDQTRNEGGRHGNET